MRLGGLFSCIGDWVDWGLDLVYPRSAGCPLCQRDACTCKQAVLEAYRGRTACPRCGKFLSGVVGCSDCLSRGPGFPDKILALGPYEGDLRDSLHRFKYNGEKRIGRFLADLLLEGPVRDLTRPDLVIPVPLHAHKLRQRGYNQSQVLAERVAAGLGAGLAADSLYRVSPTKPQAGLQREARRSNLSHAFALCQPEQVRGKAILLVDDIITTGYTLEACGNALRQGEISGLQALCVAAGIA